MATEDGSFLERAQKVNLELLKESFEQATNYTNVFIVAGYRSYFGLWSIASDRVTGPKAVIGAVLFMLVSVTIFIRFQVYNVFPSSSALLRFIDGLLEKPAKSVDEYVQRYEQYGFESTQRVIGYSRLWKWTFFFTVATGFGAVGILLYALIGAVVSGRVPCTCP